MANKSWGEKLHSSSGLPKIENIPPRMNKKWGEGTLVIATPTDVKNIMDSVNSGELITINEIRLILASKYNANFACPITTGIFAWITAHAAVEMSAVGSALTTPYWHTLKQGGEVNPKYPDGLETQIDLLVQEGHDIDVRGKKVYVRGFEKKLAHNIIIQ